MENLRLATAFGRYGATTADNLRGLSAIAADGSLVLACPAAALSRPGPGALRYENRISESKSRQSEVALLRTNLEATMSAGGVVRLIVVTPSSGSTPRVIHTRTDLVGKLLEFDGDRHVVDFSRPVEPEPEVVPKRRKR
jgi:hypothetical protein